MGAGRQTAIAVDVREDAQFDVLLALTPFSISVEGWSEGPPVRQLYGASDTGNGLHVSVTASQEAQLNERLAALGVRGAFYSRD